MSTGGGNANTHDNIDNRKVSDDTKTTNTITSDDGDKEGDDDDDDDGFNHNHLLLPWSCCAPMALEQFSSKVSYPLLRTKIQSTIC